MRSLVAVAVLFASTGAVADTGRYTAQLAQPLAAKREVVVSGNIWRCDGAACVLTSPPEDAASVRSCHQLQRQVGTLSAYGTKERPFDADKLAKCNAAG